MERLALQWKQMLFSFIVLSCISFLVSWYLGFYLRLDWTQLFLVFTGLLFAQRALINYFLPFQVIEHLVSNLSSLQLSGFVFVGLSSGFVNTWILYYRFGFLWSLVLALGAGIVGNGLLDLYLLRKRQPGHTTANIQKV